MAQRGWMRSGIRNAGVAAFACLTVAAVAAAELPDAAIQAEDLAWFELPLTLSSAFEVQATTLAPALGTGPFGAPVSASALGAARGGTDVFNDMKLKGVVADNQAVNLATGGNVIADGAFGGASGLPMVIQNSGNNVLIQSATIVNVQVQ